MIGPGVAARAVIVAALGQRFACSDQVTLLM